MLLTKQRSCVANAQLYSRSTVSYNEQVYIIERQYLFFAFTHVYIGVTFSFSFSFHSVQINHSKMHFIYLQIL